MYCEIRKIQKVTNSIMITIPVHFCKQLDLNPKDSCTLYIEGDKLVIKKLNYTINVGGGE